MGVFALVIELSTVVSMTLGFLVRPVAFCLAVFIAFAMFLSHWSNGFFLASGPGKGSGIEYTLALFLMALAFGDRRALSIDSVLADSDRFVAGREFSLDRKLVGSRLSRCSSDRICC